MKTKWLRHELMMPAKHNERHCAFCRLRSPPGYEVHAEHCPLADDSVAWVEVVVVVPTPEETERKARVAELAGACQLQSCGECSKREICDGYMQGPAIDICKQCDAPVQECIIWRELGGNYALAERSWLLENCRRFREHLLGDKEN